MPILCKIHRGDFIESIHVAYAVVVDEKGEIVYSSGDPHFLHVFGQRSNLFRPQLR